MTNELKPCPVSDEMLVELIRAHSDPPLCRVCGEPLSFGAADHTGTKWAHYVRAPIDERTGERPLWHQPTQDHIDASYRYNPQPNPIVVRVAQELLERRQSRHSPAPTVSVEECVKLIEECVATQLKNAQDSHASKANRDMSYHAHLVVEGLAERARLLLSRSPERQSTHGAPADAWTYWFPAPGARRAPGGSAIGTLTCGHSGPVGAPVCRACAWKMIDKAICVSRLTGAATRSETIEECAKIADESERCERGFRELALASRDTQRASDFEEGASVAASIAVAIRSLASHPASEAGDARPSFEEVKHAFKAARDGADDSIDYGWTLEETEQAGLRAVMALYERGAK